MGAAIYFRGEEIAPFSKRQYFIPPVNYVSYEEKNGVKNV